MDYFRFLKDNIRWLAAGVLLTFSSSFGQTYFISLFAGEIRSEFGLSHGEWGGIYTLGTATSAIVMIWSGALTDRFRVRQLGAVVFILLALACLFMASVSTVWALLLAIFALRLTGQGMASHISTVAMARWFVATRGRALSIASIGYAAGQAILPIIFVSLLVSVHWRTLWIAAAILALFAAPALIALLKHERTPQSIARDMPSLGMNNKHWTRKMVLNHWLFWLLVPSFLGPSAWGTALFFQQVHLSEVKGWSHLEFVSLLPLFTVVSVGSTFLVGSSLDRFGTGRLMPYLMLPYAAAFLVLSYADTIFMAAVGLVVLGFGAGASTTLPGAFAAEFYGTKFIGGIKSLVAALMVLGSAIGPGITGVLIDRGIDFPHQMSAISIFFLAASALTAIAVIRARKDLFHAA
jgi:MFS family permease